MEEKFIRYFREEDLFSPNEPILLAVSGGPDSIVMAHLFKTCELPFGIAHCNFNLRGTESDQEEQFVRETAEKMGVPFYSMRFETEKYAADHKISIQMAARDLRYQWLEEIREQGDYCYIATAHHLDDSIETVFINLTRGTGISGLHGILPKKGKVIRPMLFSKKEEILEYARDQKISFREDSSNSTLKYERNRIRHEVIPVFKDINPNFSKTFQQNIELLKAIENIYFQHINKCIRKLLVKRDKEFYLPIRKLKKMQFSEIILFEIVRDFGFNKTQVHQLMEVLDDEPGKIFESEFYKIIKDRKFIIITPKQTIQSSFIHIYPGDSAIETDEGKIRINITKIESYKLTDNPNIGAIDYSKLEFPLTLRKWKKGDYFYPLGMQKKKKMSNFFIDNKVPLHIKEKIWILTSGEKIVWIAGHRIDNRYKITDKTKIVYSIELHQ